MSKPVPFVVRVEDVPAVAWNDARGRLSFHTLVSGGLTPSEGLVAGVAIVEPGGDLAPHSHAPAEVYFALEGVAIVTIDGVERTLSAGAAAYIPRNARHAIRNPFDQAFKIFYVFPADRFEDIRYEFGEGA
jgi:quercetin dioxygenase-like cupin family protein